ncbi:hypothetical protein NDN08_003857 [Rhodosorus marinus]|uniref:Major facilitator superfamily (MFS) profile domain-containing protein n=1 Tax=Rhodosorus marinus TaxID=101924 RepID=A0AAV8UGM3_9RHOD|nr:hypothetical protein NDN08_003857 [Rhodosorus marinus]
MGVIGFQVAGLGSSALARERSGAAQCRTCPGSGRVLSRKWRRCVAYDQLNRDESNSFEREVQFPEVEEQMEITKSLQKPSGLSERLSVVFLTFLSFIICNMDRINVSVAILPMREYYGWSQGTVGIIQSAFFWGYILTQIPGGYLADKYGGKKVLSFGVVAWSLMTFITPMAASASLPILLLARALLGIGEGVAMPAMNSIISTWIPPNERSRSLSLIYSGMYMGSVIGLLTCPFLIQSFGWPSVFYVFGLIGIGWYGLWQIFISPSPQESKTITESERKYILDRIPKKENKKLNKLSDIPWKKLFSSKHTWAIIVAHFCCTWGYFVFLTWLPTYFNLELGFDFGKSAFVSILPWLSMFTFANAGGFIADFLYANGLTLTKVRKLMQTIGFMGPAVFLGLTARTADPILGVLFMTLALGLGSFSQSGVYANHQDIGPEYSGILLGISNTFAALPGIIGVALTGFILEGTGSWDLVFGLAIGFYALGTIVYNALGTGERVF